MFECPHCGEKGVSIWAKFWSGSPTPAKCVNCGNLSFVHSKYRLGFQSVWPALGKFVGVFLSIWLLYVTNSLWALLVLPVVWFSCSAWELATLPLTPITEERVAQGRKYGNIFLGAVLLIVVFGYLLQTL